MKPKRLEGKTMHSMFDGAEREDLARPTRRRIVYLGLLGGSALVTGAMRVAPQPTEARRKKTCKRPCNSEEKCVRGKCEPIPRP